VQVHRPCLQNCYNFVTNVIEIAGKLQANCGVFAPSFSSWTWVLFLAFSRLMFMLHFALCCLSRARVEYFLPHGLHMRLMARSQGGCFPEQTKKGAKTLQKGSKNAAISPGGRRDVAKKKRIFLF